MADYNAKSAISVFFYIVMADFMMMLTTFGVQTNEHYVAQVQNQIKMDALFESL